MVKKLNRLKSNPCKCHNLASTNKYLNVKIGDYTIGKSECEKLLVVKIDVNLNFNNYISDLRKKASTQISALARVAPFMSFDKSKLLMDAFITSYFSYCPLILVCRSSANNRKINMLHKRCLKIIYNDKQSSFN